MVDPDDLDPPASPGQPVHDGGDDGFHRRGAVCGHVDVTAEAIDEAVGLNRVAAGDDERESVANFQNVLQQSPVQVVEVHGVAGCLSLSSGKADSQTLRTVRLTRLRRTGHCPRSRSLLR